MRIGTFSRGICKLPNVLTTLEAEHISLLKPNSSSDEVDLVVGWGRKGNTLNAQSWARNNNVPYVSMEDGFIRSPGLGRKGTPSLSHVVDHSGIYYDATTQSDLEKLLESPHFAIDVKEEQRAKSLISRMLDHQVSKYTGAPEYTLPDNAPTSPRILIVDQVKTDASVYFGRASHFNLEDAVKTARKEHPFSRIVVKLHPETIQGFRKGFYNASTLDLGEVEIVDYDVNPLSLIKTVEQVYVGTSQLGFEALLLEKTVTCFGMPFYAGWGLTDDRQSCARRSQRRSVTEVFVAAYLHYSRYINPVTGKACELEDILDILARQQPLAHSKAFCHGIRHWKRYNILPFIPAKPKDIHFVGTTAQAKQLRAVEGDQVMVWGSRNTEDLDALLKLTNSSVVRMEDGFLRSVGLGSNFIKPNSLVLDKTGIYFDPNSPSDLEDLINNAAYTIEQLSDAEALKCKLIKTRLSKYNEDNETRSSLKITTDKTIILIPGQVADDASLKLGCVDVKSNEELILQVRQDNPDAYLIYKPHPDVLSGNRKGKVSEQVVRQHCDLLSIDHDIASCLDAADEVHTMTSLVGFEALIRDIPVTCYGLPFYASWGLTRDKHSVERRRRDVTTQELVHACLVSYPLYYDWDSGYFCSCEEIIDKLVIEKEAALTQPSLWKSKFSFLFKRLRQAQLIVKGSSYAR